MMFLKQIRTQAGMTLIIPVLIFLFAGVVSAQPDTLWTNSVHNAGYNLQVIRTTDRGYIVGTSGWAGDEERYDPDFQLIKLDSLGNHEWHQFYPGLYNNRHGADTGYTVCQTADGGYVLGGSRHGCVLIRTDDVGDTLWMRYYLSDDGFRSPLSGAMKCLITTDNEIIFNTHNILVKVAYEDGAVIWHQEYNAKDISSILHSDNGGYYITGWTDTFGAGSNDIYAAEIDADGELIWEEAYGNENSNVSSRSELMSGDEICIIGSIKYGADVFDTHPYIVLIDNEGNLIWERVYEDIRGVSVKDLVETPDGGFAVAGHTAWYRLFRFDYSGDILWNTSFGHYRDQNISGEAYSLHLMEDGGYLLGGFSDLGLWLVRTEPDPVDLPVRIRRISLNLDFAETPIDSVSTLGLGIYNFGRRYAIIDSIYTTGDTEAFSCSIDEAERINPSDTTYFPVTFQPTTDTLYTAIVHLWHDEEEIEVPLSGRGVILSVPEESNVLNDFSLYNAYPNPFNGEIRIGFSLSRTSLMTLSVFDVNGRQVDRISEGSYNSGQHQLVWNASLMPAGSYFLNLEIDGHSVTRKIAVIK